MKKGLLITVGTTIIVLVIGVWAYLFLYGTPESTSEIFGNFNRGEEGDREPVIVETDAENNTAQGSRQALRQLTTKPVAGAVLSSGAIRYVERGTGHIFDIPLTGGDELLVSNVTIPQTVSARFSTYAGGVILTSQRNEVNETVVSHIAATSDPSQALTGASLPSDVSNVTWKKDGTSVFYLLETPQGSTAFEYNLADKKTTELFTLPLRDVEILWASTTHLYTTPTARQFGYVYRVGKDGLEYITDGARGLMALPYDTGIVITESQNGTLTSHTTESLVLLPFPLIPEKCVSHPVEASVFFCGGMVGMDQGEYPDDWYKGEKSFVDLLWKVNVETGEAVLLSHLLSESGREIDIAEIGTDAKGEQIYFINKNDGTLWIFDTTL